MKIVVHMILTLFIIGVISGGVLSIVNNWAAPLIAANQKAETEKAIFIVHENAKKYERINYPNNEIYKVLDSENNLIGYSIANEGNGFQGKIRMMIGLTKDLSKITSIKILEQVETPGLGTRVTEQPFTQQFINLITTPKIEWVKGKAPSKPNEIQAITGATISSKSVVAIINNAIEKTRKQKSEGGL